MHFSNHLLRRLVIAGATTCLSLSAIAAPPASAPGKQKAPEFSNQAFDLQYALETRAELHQWLRSERVGRGAGLKADVTADEMHAIDAERGVLPERVGITKAVAANVSFRGLSRKQLRGRAHSRGFGVVTGAADGGYVFSGELSSPGAIGMRVHFTGFNLPQGAGVYLYTGNGQVFGPYTGRGPHGDGEFWSHTVLGESLTLQMRQTGRVSDRVMRKTRFTVAGIGHLRPKFLAGQCNYNESCIESTACVNESSAVNTAKKAVAHIQWPQGPFIYMCSGGLLADTDTGTRPLFLTANHCISRGKDAKNMEAFFQLDLTGTSPGCGGSFSCDDVFDHQSNHPQNLRVLGARILATGSTSDYTLMELRQAAPTGSAFMGWNDTDISTSTDDLYRISHPSGAPQSYSEHEVDSNYVVCGGWPVGDWIYSRDTFGSTEGGSSGSPVVNGAGEVVGQLTGGCGYNINDVCDAVENRTVDGAFSAYFSEVEEFLDPTTSCTVTETPEVSCNDGQDNDCDGLTDNADDDCGGPGLPKGASCTSDTQCISNKCKGPANNKTCK